MKYVIFICVLTACAAGDNIQAEVKYSQSVADDWQDDPFTWDGVFTRVCFNDDAKTVEVRYEFQWVGSYYDVDAQAWDLVYACTGHRPSTLPPCGAILCNVSLRPEVPDNG